MKCALLSRPFFAAAAVASVEPVAAAVAFGEFFFAVAIETHSPEETKLNFERKEFQRKEFRVKLFK